MNATPCDLLVIGTSVDSHIDSVLRHLPSGLSYFRFNVNEYPSGIRLTFLIDGKRTPTILAEKDNRSYDISRVDSVWFRRIGSPTLDPNITNRAHRTFALGEVESTIMSLAHLLPHAKWVSPYQDMKRAVSKPLQLKIATECGLLIPNTLITNDVEQAARFVNANQPSIYKTIHSPSVVYEDNRTLIFSHLLTKTDEEKLQQVQYSPCQFQKYIEKAYELRITVTGERLFAAKIDSQASDAGKVDWRAAGVEALQHEIASLPFDIENKLKCLVKRLGLSFGAIDMIVTPAGEYVFLEINPHGAWLWLEDLLQMPISESLAQLLVAST